MNLNFYKESDNRWYIDLPNWLGSKADLEMVSGADTMLDYMVEGTDKVLLFVSEVEKTDKLEFIRMATEIGDGAFYKLENYKGVYIGLEIWLCDVTKFIFGYFPKLIHISPIS